MVLPQSAKRALYRRYLGWTIADDAYVGLTLLSARHVVLGAGARIGHFNVVLTGVRTFSLGAGAWVGNFNQFSGTSYEDDFPDASFRLGDRSLVMSWHFFDCSGGVRVGSGCTVGGRGSQFWSHSLDLSHCEGRLRPKSVAVGDSAYLGAGIMVVECEVPAAVTVAAGTVLTRSLTDVPPQSVIAGNPGKVVRRGPKLG